MRRFIKGKDGKFKGSVPSLNSRPSSLPSNAIPSKPEDSPSNQVNQGEELGQMAARLRESTPQDRPVEQTPWPVWDDVDLTVSHDPDSGTYTLKKFESQDERVPDWEVRARLSRDPAGGYEATITEQSRVIDPDDDLILTYSGGYLDWRDPNDTDEGSYYKENYFYSKKEAEAWISSEMETSAKYLMDFDNTWKQSPTKIQDDIDAAVSDPNTGWTEIREDEVDKNYYQDSIPDPDDPSGVVSYVVYRDRITSNVDMRAVNPNRSVRIRFEPERDLYEVVIRKHDGENDKYGRLLVSRSIKTFDEAAAFGRYIGTGAADKHLDAPRRWLSNNDIDKN